MEKHQDLDARLQVLRKQFEQMRQPALVRVVRYCQYERNEARKTKQRK